MQLVPGTIIGGKYRLDRPVSRGGMGSVWAARHVQLGSPVAVKFMDPTYVSSPVFRARFEREARASATLQSPHVVSVQDYGVDGGVPYLVMELLHGEDLHARLERSKRISPDDAWRILVQIGKALRRAHEAGLVHRDLKPRNVFLATIDDDEVVKILDFGIAKETGVSVAGDATKTGEIVGSPHYMSPEQLRADRGLDGRSDLWSVGVILFRCLTGQLPFPGEVLGSVMAKILVDEIPPASRIAPDLPPSVDAFFARALARDREQRFQSVRELVDAFGQIVGARARLGTLQGDVMSPVALLNTAVTPLPLPLAPPPLPLTPNTPVGTLTSAGVVDAPGLHGRRMRVMWGAAIGAFLLVGTTLTVTLFRLTGAEESDPAVAGDPPPAAPAIAAPSPEPAGADPVAATTELAPPPPEPAPPPTAASSAPRAAPAAPTAESSAKAVRPSQTAASTAAAPAQSTPGKRPAWGF
jgi:serine/threonine-protein kinase